MKRIEDAPKDCILTYSGIYVNVFEPTTDMFVIEDIAHALSHECRFSGHVPRFYSVAQHSILCMNLASNEAKFQSLMHDASEAYLRDIATPIKQRLSGYKEIENNLMKVIGDKFGFNWPMLEEVKHIDAAMLQFEWDNLMSENNLEFETYNSSKAKEEFLKAYYSICKSDSLLTTL